MLVYILRCSLIIYLWMNTIHIYILMFIIAQTFLLYPKDPDAILMSEVNYIPFRFFLYKENKKKSKIKQ